jgi:phi13 family phage major tail protein
MATRIGCDMLHYAAMTTEDTDTAAPVYATPTNAPGVMSVSINPNGSLDTLFADDGPMESASTLGKIEVEIKKNQLTTANKADLLGHLVDSNKALVYGDSDTPPWVALLFRTLKSNGNYRYVCLYKGKFTEPEDTSETKGDSINFQSDTIKGQFVKLNYAYTVATKSVRPWKYEADQDDAGVAATVFSGWFTKVPFPNATQA